MNRLFFLCVAAGFTLALVGCAGEEAGDTTATIDSPSQDLGTASTAPESPDSEPAAAGDEVAVTPENTKIQFVGIHVGDKPDPRTGTFESFAGKAVLSEGKLTSLSVEIDTTSVQTEMDKLTNHLKSPDFFDVNEHPKATFQSTSIEEGENGVNVTGDFTLLGKTNSISFPATVSTADGLTLKAEFEIDRTKFGMEYSVDKVAKEVAMTITIGG